MEINIQGAPIYGEIPILGGIPITATMVVTWAVMLVLTLLCIWLTHDLKVNNVSKRQAVAEFIVGWVEKLVGENMGVKDLSYAPFVAAILALSAGSSLSSLLGEWVWPPTADLNTELAWALVVFVIITYRKFRTNGFFGYWAGYWNTVSLAEANSGGMKVFSIVINTIFTPLNLMGELFTPLSMSFRHFGNILSGVVINTLIYAALMGLNLVVFGWLPGAVGTLLGHIPFLAVGVPAVLSLYFDWFTAVMQAFIFSMLTMMYIAQANE